MDQAHIDALKQGQRVADSGPRAERFFRAFKVVPERELFAALSGLTDAEHIFACDAKCLMGSTPPGGCFHPKKTFLSTRNSRRSCHVYLFLFYLFGDSGFISDEMLKNLRKYLRPTCEYGLNECNGHARSRSGPVCINPFHYLIVEPAQVLRYLVVNAPIRWLQRNLPSRPFCDDIHRAFRIGAMRPLGAADKVVPSAADAYDCDDDVMSEGADENHVQSAADSKACVPDYASSSCLPHTTPIIRQQSVSRPRSSHDLQDLLMLADAACRTAI